MDRSLRVDVVKGVGPIVFVNLLGWDSARENPCENSFSGILLRLNQFWSCLFNGAGNHNIVYVQRQPRLQASLPT